MVVDVAGGSPVSIDELVARDAAALDDGELKATLVDFARARSRLDAAEAHAIGELDRRGCFVVDGSVTAASWLAHHSGVRRVIAAGRVRLAKRLRFMPATHAALASGTLTDGHVRVLARCLNPRTVEAFARDEELLVALAAAREADDVDAVVTEWLLRNDPDGATPNDGDPSVGHGSRTLGGRVKVDADLDAADGAEFLAEWDALADELWREDRDNTEADPNARRSRQERYGAALAEMAQRSSATRRQDLDDDHTEAAGDQPTARSRPRRPQLLVITPLPALTGQPGAVAELDDGTIVPPGVLERWACDCAIGRVVMNGASQPVDLGKLTYTPSDPQRRGLYARDRRCITNGCRRRARWTEAHHVIPWPHGPTNLANLVLLCKRHHTLIHNGTLQLHPTTPTKDHPTPWTVARADGTPLYARPPPTLPG